MLFPLMLILGQVLSTPTPAFQTTPDQLTQLRLKAQQQEAHQSIQPPSAPPAPRMSIFDNSLILKQGDSFTLISTGAVLGHGPRCKIEVLTPSAGSQSLPARFLVAKEFIEHFKDEITLSVIEADDQGKFHKPQDVNIPENQLVVAVTVDHYPVGVFTP